MRRPATTARPQRGANATKANATRSGQASEPIPVLIRLPELHIEPERKADSEVRAAQDPSQVTIPLLPTPLDSVPSPERHAESPRPDSSAGVTGEPTGARAVSPLGQRGRSCFVFGLPRWAVCGAIAAGLAAVLAIAYLTIAGRSPNLNPAIAESDMANIATLPPSSVPTVGLPATPTVQAAASTPASSDTAKEKDVGKEADEADLAVKEPAEAPGANGSQTEQQPADAAKSSGPSVGETPAPSPQEGTIARARLGTATASGGLDSGGPAKASADADSREPLTSGTTQPDAAAGGDVPDYPVTSPATFQYPPDYHERLQMQTSSGQSGNGWPAPGGAGPDDRQPSTARLQPSIEPPPMR